MISAPHIRSGCSVVGPAQLFNHFKPLRRVAVDQIRI